MIISLWGAFCQGAYVLFPLKTYNKTYLFTISLVQVISEEHKTYIYLTLAWYRLSYNVVSPHYQENVCVTGDIDEAVVVVIVWQFDLQLPMQSVSITTSVLSSNPVHDKLYSIQHYVIKFVSDLQQVSGFLSVLTLTLTLQKRLKVQSMKKKT